MSTSQMAHPSESLVTNPCHSSELAQKNCLNDLVVVVEECEMTVSVDAGKRLPLWFQHFAAQ